MLPHLGEAREAPHAGEIFRQPDLAATLRKLVEAESQGAGRRKVAEGGDPRGLRTLLHAATSPGSSCAGCKNRADS